MAVHWVSKSLFLLLATCFLSWGENQKAVDVWELEHSQLDLLHLTTNACYPVCSPGLPLKTDLQLYSYSQLYKTVNCPKWNLPKTGKKKLCLQTKYKNIKWEKNSGMCLWCSICKYLKETSPFAWSYNHTTNQTNYKYIQNTVYNTYPSELKNWRNLTWQ